VVLSRPIENSGDLFTDSGRVVGCCLLNFINISALSSRITQRALLRTLLDLGVVGKVLNLFFKKKYVAVWSLLTFHFSNEQELVMKVAANDFQ
jgi:hypothetical protein